MDPYELKRIVFQNKGGEVLVETCLDEEAYDRADLVASVLQLAGHPGWKTVRIKNACEQGDDQARQALYEREVLEDGY